MRISKTPIIYVVLLAVSLFAQALEQGATSQEALRKQSQIAFGKRDAALVKALVYWRTGETEADHSSFARVLDYAFQQGGLRQVEIVPVPNDEILEYVRAGVTYCPSLTPIGQLMLTYGAAGNGTSVKFLVGRANDRYYITLAAPVSK